MNPILRNIDIGIITLSSFLIFFSRFLHSGLDLYFFYSDDFFYYLKIAENISSSGFSSFNGIVETNGYHPLWQIALVVLLKIFPSDSIFIIIAIIQSFSSILSYILLKKIFSKLLSDNINIMSSSIIFLIIVLMTKSGMETILTIPLMILAIYFLFNKKDKIFLLSLILTIMILSRLDSVIFAGLIYLFLFINSKFSFKIVTKIFLGTLPLLLYLLYNYVTYDHLMPVSGAAKQLKETWLPVWYPIQGIFELYPGKIIFALIPTIMLVMNIFFMIIKRSKIQLLLSTFVLFPVILLLFYCFRSGWNLWSWYYYMLIPSTIVFFINFNFLFKRFSSLLKYAALFAVLSWIFLNVNTKKPIKDAKYQSMVRMIEFMKDKNGVLAMGDAAGLPGYVLDQPIIQLEGLVMDFDYLEMVKKGDLKQIFKKYKVDYYITISSTNDGENWIFTEPWNHHPYIINTNMNTKKEPIYSGGDNWLDFRIWDVREFR
jgi:hypothetical protein